MSESKVYFKKKDYDLLYQKCRKQLVLCEMHPLHKDWGISKKKEPKQSKQIKVTSSNVLSNDPLSRLVRKPETKITASVIHPQPSLKETVVIQEQTNIKKDVASPWMLIRGEFIKAYDLTKENTSALVANPFGSYGARKQEQLKMSSNLIKSSSNTKNDNSNIKQIEIKTYLAMLQDYKKQLKSKWQCDDKVAALQLTIQSTKLLHDTQKAKFQALKFAYVIDIVESFGIYVYQRIKTLSFRGVPAQKIKQIEMHQLVTHNIPDEAQTVCRNWLLKVGAIRQLMPRSIIEATLIRLYFFIDNGKRVKHILYRLAKTNRCFGQYINSIFFSTFLIRIGTQILPKQKDYILNILDDVFTYMKQGKTKFNHPELSTQEYFKILEPFFKTAFQGLGQNLDESDFKRLTKSLPPNPHPLIIKNLISSFNLKLVGLGCVQLMKMIQRVPKEGRYSLYSTFLKKLANSQFQNGKQLIQELWNHFSDIQDMGVFLQILAPFVEIIFLNIKSSFRISYINSILQKFNTLNISQSTQSDQFFVKFEEFLISMLENTTLSNTLTIQPFLQTITYFPKTVKQKISKSVVTIFMKRQQSTLSDPMIVNTILTLIKNIDKDKEAPNIILSLLKKIDFGNDFQGQLNFYSDVRASFGYVSSVTVDIINKAALLSLKVKRNARGKVRSFLQACIGFCYITIPLIESQKKKTQLYLYISELALSFNLISQSNDLLKMAIRSLTECKDESLQQNYQVFQKMIGFLIVTPDDPEIEYLFLFKGLVTAFQQMKAKDQTKLLIYSDFLVYLSAQVQDKLPLHIQGVVSNDYLFKMKDFRDAVMGKLLQTFTKIQALVDNLKSGQEDINKIRVVVSSTASLLNILRNNDRFSEYLKNIGKLLGHWVSKMKDKKLVTTLKPYLKWILQKMKEQDFQISWSFIDVI